MGKGSNNVDPLAGREREELVGRKVGNSNNYCNDRSMGWPFNYFDELLNVFWQTLYQNTENVLGGHKNPTFSYPLWIWFKLNNIILISAYIRWLFSGTYNTNICTYYIIQSKCHKSWIFFYSYVGNHKISLPFTYMYITIHLWQ